ncbi:MAG: O-antigen ligase family protein [Telluria sp.]|nr:O-antigen ligase family protein [Telluria sp.]
MNNNLIKMMDPRQALIAALIFLFPFLSLITDFGVSLSSFTFVLAAPFFLKPGRAALARHWPEIRWVVFAFAFNFLYALLLFLVRDEATLPMLEKPVRMLFAVSALMLVLVLKPDRKLLWWGVIAGALAGALLVGYQRAELDLDRPGGLINPITFGDLSLCLGLVALAATLDFRRAHRAIWPGLGAIAGLLGSILTGTRGGWVALALAAFLFVRYSHVLSARRVRALMALGAVLLAGSYFVPDTGVRERVAQGVADVESYVAGGSAFTNVGIRLELWKGASMLIKERPLLGVDRLAYPNHLRAYVEQGRLDPVVLPMPHLHNDALQSLVTGGIPGLLAWSVTLLAPFMFFARVLARHESVSQQQLALALAGLLVVTSYFSFGLTEVIFWSVKGSMFYALMIFLLMGFCLNAKENDGK